VDPGAGMDDVEKRKFLTLAGLELRHLGRPARSQSLSRLVRFVDKVYRFGMLQQEVRALNSKLSYVS
jgi:hypothetical protein